MKRVYTDARDIAKATNFGTYPVLMWDMDKKEGSKVRAPKEGTQYGTMYYNCQLRRGYSTEDDGIFYLSTGATVIKGQYGVEDFVKDAEYANAPVVKSNQAVAILVHSRELNLAAVIIVKSGKVDPTFSTATTFTLDWEGE